MPKYRTVHKFSQEYEFPEYRLRQWIKQRRVPGWYSGNRFMVDVDAFISQLETESLGTRVIDNSCNRNEKDDSCSSDLQRQE